MIERVQTELLQAESLQAVLETSCGIDMNVTVHDVIDSTNAWSLQQCKSGAKLPFACFAEQQIKGMGRRGKPWLMSAGSDIAMSVCWPFNISQQQIHLLPISIALAVVKTLEEFKLKGVQVKWPNDVYIQDKKISGILIETQPLKSSVDRNVDRGKLAVVIGVGLNYDMSAVDSEIVKDFLEDVSLITDIKHEMDSQKNSERNRGRDQVAAVLLKNVVSVCQSFEQDSDNNMEAFRTRYDYCKNKSVEIRLDNKEVLFGVALGVNELAELVVMIDGKARAFNSAEISVRANKQ